MHRILSEFILSWRRIWRRKAQNGLMFGTFAVSVGLALLSWSLFYSIFLSRPEFDPKGDLGIVTYAGTMAANSGRQHSTRLEMDAWQAEQTVFAEFAPMVFYRSCFIITHNGVERLFGSNVSSTALRMVGARPLLGRLLTPADDKLGCAPVVLLSYPTWQNQFGADPGVIGKVVSIDNTATSIVGVMPRDFRFPNNQEIWLSMGNAPEWRGYPIRDALVRLKPGITPQRAEADLEEILSRHRNESEAFKLGFRPLYVPFRDFYIGPSLQVSALILFALSLIFVIVACSNVANLMLTDFLGRLHEVATSFALGIPLAAVIRTVCFQVVIVALTAVAASFGFLLLAAPIFFRSLVLFSPPYWLKFARAPHDVLIALLLVALSSLITLIAPVTYLLFGNADEIIRQHAYAARATGQAPWRRVLLAGQITLLTVLAVCMAFLLRSSIHVNQDRWGYDARPVFVAKLDLHVASTDHSSAQQRNAIYQHVLREVESVPGVNAAAIVENGPGYSLKAGATYALDAAAFASHTPLGSVNYTGATEGAFKTLGLTFVKGQAFHRTVSPSAHRSAVINQGLAEKLWPGQDPLQRGLYINLGLPDSQAPPEQVIICGVVKDFQASGPMSANNDALYVSFNEAMPYNVFLLVRGQAIPPGPGVIHDAVHRADSGIAFYIPDSLSHQIDAMLSPIRLTTRLTLIFAVAAILLCAVGIYSLTISQILQSSRSLGIKMALGAEPHRLWWQFTRSHLLIVSAGIMAGLILAHLAMSVLHSLLFGVERHGAMTYGAVIFGILWISALACLPGLFRLKSINPADCLRSL